MRLSLFHLSATLAITVLAGSFAGCGPRIRGLSATGVRLRHALRHTLIPLITLSGFILASLIGGTVVTEALFARQGIGRLMVEATTNKDIPLVLGIALLAAGTYVVGDLAVDLINAVVDPRHSARPAGSFRIHL